MANPEHLKILKQGVEVWNRWREENPGITPDLAIAHMEHHDLSRANLSNAHLANAHLVGARLSGARLKDAFMPSVDLSGAILDGANFMNVVLTSSSLLGANLKRASLMNAGFSDVDLREANLQGARMLRTSIDGSNLSETLGLASVSHDGPSSIGTNTLERTARGLLANDAFRGEIEEFYRGAGVEEHVIDYFREYRVRPIEYHSCFISYSHNDKQFARRLHDQLQARGIRCWHDERDLKPGDRILDGINDAIRVHGKILLCCSESSLNSWWVRDEIRKAQDRERKEDRLIVVPLNLDGYLFKWDDGLASDLTTRLAVDFTGCEHNNAKFEEQFEKVVKALRTDERARDKAPKSKK